MRTLTDLFLNERTRTQPKNLVHPVEKEESALGGAPLPRDRLVYRGCKGNRRKHKVDDEKTGPLDQRVYGKDAHEVVCGLKGLPTDFDPSLNPGTRMPIVSKVSLALRLG